MSEQPTNLEAEANNLEAPEVADPARHAAAMALVQKLMNASRGEFLQCAMAMLTARQAYYVFLQSMRRLCAEEEYDPLVGDIIVDMMAQRGLQQFGISELLERIPAFVGYLKYEAGAQQTLDHEAWAAAKKEAEELRRAEELPLPFPVWHSVPSRNLSRKHPLLIVARPPLVKFWLNAASGELIAKGRRVLRLSADKLSTFQKKGVKSYVEVSRELWAGKLSSPRKINDALGPWLSHFRDNAIDALVIDNSAITMDEGSGIILSGDLPQSGKSPKGELLAGPFVRTAHALRILRRWCELNGCGLIMGMPLGVDEAIGAAADRFGPNSVNALANLTEHTCLRDSYSWEQPGDQLKLTLGQFVVHLPNTCLKELNDDERRISPIAGDLLGLLCGARDACIAGAAIQAEREHEGRDAEGESDRGEASEVAGGDGVSAVHRAAREGLHGGSDSETRGILIGGDAAGSV